MADGIQFGGPHEEAIRILQGKVRVSRDAFDALLPELRARAFTITGIAGFDVMQRVQDSIASLAGGAEGLTWEEAKAQITSELSDLGAEAERRAELLLRTHGFQAFQAANWEAAQADGDTTHLQYLATEDDKVRDSHKALNGLILPKGDPFWDTHMPPWEWGCRCRVRSINPDLLEEARQADLSLPADQRRVIEGPAAQQLRSGTLMRDGRRFDVRPPVEKQSAEDGQPFRWHPDNLRLPLKTVLDRYDPDVRAAFESWARATTIPESGESVWSWSSQDRSKPRSRGSTPWVFRPSSLVERIRETGVSSDEARQLARYMQTDFEIVGEEIIVRDPSGAEVRRLPRRILG